MRTIIKERICEAPSSKDHTHTTRHTKSKLYFLLMNLDGDTLKIYQNQNQNKNLIVLMRNLTGLVGIANTIDWWKGASII